MCIRDRTGGGRRAIATKQPKKEEQEGEEEVLVPIRIDIVAKEREFSDAFCWNINERRITPESFAKQTCLDQDLPSAFEHPIATSIRNQLASFASARAASISHSTSTSTSATNNGVGGVGGRGGGSCGDSGGGEEKLMIVKLDITINGIRLRDQFEWDVANPYSNPELFASRTVKDMNLPSDFIPAIVTRIREQTTNADHLVMQYKAEQQQQQRERTTTAAVGGGASGSKGAMRDVKEAATWGPQLTLVPTPSSALPASSQLLSIKSSKR